VEKVRSGSELVDESGKVLSEIMESVKRVRPARTASRPVTASRPLLAKASGDDSAWQEF
jgi:hypothetical protein